MKILNLRTLTRLGLLVLPLVGTLAYSQTLESIAGNPGMAKRCIESASNSGYQYQNCPDGGSPLLYTFLTEDWSDENRNTKPGAWYCAYNGTCTNGDPSYMVGVAHNWPPYQHVQHPLNYFWWTGSPGNWEANIQTAQWADRLIYSQEANFNPAQNYVANGIEERTGMGMTMPDSLDSVILDGKLTLMHTQNPDARIVAKFVWHEKGADASYILEINLWSSRNNGGWCLDQVLCGYSTHAGAHKAYIILGGLALGFPTVSTSGGTEYSIDWGNTISQLQNLDCSSVGGPNPCLPANLPKDGNDFLYVSTGFMTERSNFGEVWLKVADMDVLQAVAPPTPPSTRALYRTYNPGAGDHMFTTNANESPYYHVEATWWGYDNAQTTPAPSHAIYRCRAGGNHFVSTDPNCEGQAHEGLLGYLLDGNPNDGQHLALRRCRNGGDHFVSTSGNCEGAANEGVLGYIRTGP